MKTVRAAISRNTRYTIGNKRLEVNKLNAERFMRWFDEVMEVKT